MKIRFWIIIAIIGIFTITVLLNYSLEFDDFAIYLCDSWFFNTCIKIWEDPDCHRPGSGCIMSEKPDSEQLERIFDYCNTKETGIAMIQSRWTYSNDTHYIDNGICEWRLLDEVDIGDVQKALDSCACFESGGDCYMEEQHFRNATHYFDNVICEWSTLDEN